MPAHSTWSRTVVVLDRSKLDRQLDAAVDMARAEANQDARHGILVTRQSPAIFTVGLSDDVPYGVTKEMHAW